LLLAEALDQHAPAFAVGHQAGALRPRGLVGHLPALIAAAAIVPSQRCILRAPGVAAAWPARRLVAARAIAPATLTVGITALAASVVAVTLRALATSAAVVASTRRTIAASATVVAPTALATVVVAARPAPVVASTRPAIVTLTAMIATAALTAR